MTPRTEDAIARIPFHTSARSRVINEVERFASALIVQAKLETYQQGDPQILVRHVEEALDAVTRERRQGIRRDVAISMGGALFGAGISALITETTAQVVRGGLIWIYVGLITLGIAILVWGIFGFDRQT